MMPATNDNLHGNVLSLLPPSEVEARVPLQIGPYEILQAYVELEVP
jgi:hypothetical protein